LRAAPIKADTTPIVPKRTQSLVRRLERILVRAMGTALLVSVVLITTEEVIQRKAAVVNASEAWVSTLAIQGESPVLFDDAKTASEILQAGSLYPGMQSVSMLRKDGSTLATHASKGQPVLTAADVAPVSRTAYFEQALRVAKPITVSGETVGLVVAQIDLMPMWHGIGQFLAALVVVLGLSGFGATLIARKFLRRAFVPITDLRKIMEEVAQHETFSIRAQVAANDEVGALTSVFNHMLDQIVRRDALLAEKNARQEALKDAAEQASNSKSEFLALMSHELRTPMAGVLGMLSLSLRGQMAPAVRERIELASANAEALLQIVNDLLDTSKIEAGKLVLEHIDFALMPTLQDAMRLLHERAREKSIAFNVHIDPALPTYFRGDPVRLRQVLLNLVGNAIKFTDRGGITISVKPDTTRPTTGDGRRWVYFEVKDTGIGMSQEAQSRMFRKFEQADTSTTRKFGGTGLGLSISKQLVDLMGGEIALRSRLGEGSTFHFSVPLAPGEQPADAEVYAASPHDYQLRVLVAEDAETNQIIIKALLEEMGHTVSMAANGEEALERLTREHVDLILMDGRMPIMDGLEATGHIRAGFWRDWVFPNRHIPIIALTANASAQDRERFLAAGMDDFLTKPIDESALYTALTAVIHKLLAAGQTLQPRASNDLSALDALTGAEALPAPPPALPAAGQPPTDPLATKPTQLSSALVAHLQNLFMDQVPGHLQEITDAVAAGDWHTAAIVAHTMKGRVVYFWPDSRIYTLCSDMEQQADAGESEAFMAHFAELQAALKAAMSQAPATDAPSDTPEAAIARLRCVNSKAGLKHMGGRRDLYLNILERFLQSQADALHQAEAQLRDGRPGDAVRTIHTLKGLASTIGAESLADAAQTLESLLAGLDRWDEADAAYQSAYQHVAAALRPLVSELTVLAGGVDKPPATLPGAPAQPADITLLELATLLREYDGNTPWYFAHHRASLQRVIPDDVLTRMAHLIGAFDFDGAGKLLEALPGKTAFTANAPT
jgi:signal transduction histidine kinase/CheY-like chemotaxis protein